jgi:hypothetical protein
MSSNTMQTALKVTPVAPAAPPRECTASPRGTRTSLVPPRPPPLPLHPPPPARHRHPAPPPRKPRQLLVRRRSPYVSVTCRLHAGPRPVTRQLYSSYIYASYMPVTRQLYASYIYASYMPATCELQASYMPVTRQLQGSYRAAPAASEPRSALAASPAVNWWSAERL